MRAGQSARLAHVAPASGLAARLAREAMALLAERG
jgi:hypothetical protein